jgi:hypothetical protein
MFKSSFITFCVQSAKTTFQFLKTICTFLQLKKNTRTEKFYANKNALNEILSPSEPSAPGAGKSEIRSKI